MDTIIILSQSINYRALFDHLAYMHVIYDAYLMHVTRIIFSIMYTRSGYEVFCNVIGSLLAGY